MRKTFEFIAITTTLGLAAFVGCSGGDGDPKTTEGTTTATTGQTSTGTQSTGSTTTAAVTTTTGSGPGHCTNDGQCDTVDGEDCACDDCKGTSLCVIDQCVPDGKCTLDDACTCDDCDNDGFCGDPKNCNHDGVCNSFAEGCVCADCADHPHCEGKTGAGGGGMGGAGGAGGEGGS